jgi:hypothetical protein
MDILLGAGRLKRELKRSLPASRVKTSLGSIGQMDIFVDGKLLYSYRSQLPMPTTQDILKLLQTA